MADLPDFVIPGSKGTCPHCGARVVFAAQKSWDLPLQRVDEDEDVPITSGVDLHAVSCPGCNGFVLDFVWWNQDMYSNEQIVTKAVRAYPAARNASRPREVPDNLWKIFDEARGVARISSSAGAMLARACLQQILRAQGLAGHTLDEEIKAAENDARVTSSLRKKLHMVRVVGNYAAHPAAGGPESMLVVEPGEVEAALATLEEAFDVFYVRPAQDEQLLAAVNAKLVAANKSPIT